MLVKKYKLGECEKAAAAQDEKVLNLKFKHRTGSDSKQSCIINTAGSAEKHRKTVCCPRILILDQIHS